MAATWFSTMKASYHSARPKVVHGFTGGRKSGYQHGGTFLARRIWKPTRIRQASSLFTPAYASHRAVDLGGWQAVQRSLEFLQRSFQFPSFTLAQASDPWEHGSCRRIGSFRLCVQRRLFGCCHICQRKAPFEFPLRTSTNRSRSVLLRNCTSLGCFDIPMNGIPLTNADLSMAVKSAADSIFCIGSLSLFDDLRCDLVQVKAPSSAKSAENIRRPGRRRRWPGAGNEPVIQKVA